MQKVFEPVIIQLKVCYCKHVEQRKERKEGGEREESIVVFLELHLRNLFSISK